MKSNHTGLKRIVFAGLYSWRGLRAGWMSEAALRQEFMLLAVGAPVALLLPLEPLEKALLLCSLLALIVVELLNSAIEAVVDRIGSEYHPLSGQAKDMGSAAVLITILATIGLWATILIGALARNT